MRLVGRGSGLLDRLTELLQLRLVRIQRARQPGVQRVVGRHRGEVAPDAVLVLQDRCLLRLQLLDRRPLRRLVLPQRGQPLQRGARRRRQRLLVQQPHDHRRIVGQQRGLLALEPVDEGGELAHLARLQRHRHAPGGRGLLDARDGAALQCQRAIALLGDFHQHAARLVGRRGDRHPQHLALPRGDVQHALGGGQRGERRLAGAAALDRGAQVLRERQQPALAGRQPAEPGVAGEGRRAAMRRTASARRPASTIRCRW